MSHALSPAMDALRRPPVLFLATCWRLTRRDGFVLRLTDADSELTMASGEVFTPSNAAQATASRSENDLESRSVEVAGVLDSSAISDVDIRAGLYRDAMVESWVVDRRFPWQGHYQFVRYWMSAPTFDKDRWQAELRGFGSRISGQVGEVASKMCKHELGDGYGKPSGGCKVDLSLFTVTDLEVVDVSTDSPELVFTLDHDSVNADNAYALGKITWLTGANAGRISRVRSDAKVNTNQQLITLLIGTEAYVAVGDRCNLSLGCNKLSGWSPQDTSGHCKNRYGVGGEPRPEFGGDPYIPGSGKVLRRPL